MTDEEYIKWLDKFRTPFLIVLNLIKKLCKN